MASTRSVRLTPLLAALALLLVAPLTVAVAEVSDTIQVVKEGEALSNLEIVARLAEATFDGPTQRVLIGREDNFADNMSSAVMQGDAPLLLVPSGGPVPQRVRDLLDLYDPEEIVLLGGEAALSPAVEEELEADYTVSRRSGPTRFETAIDIAQREAPAAQTAILSRGFGSTGSSDETQAFADALSAGGWAADQGWPVLFTTTDALPTSVREYLGASQITTMMIMGGTAAVSQEVQDELEGMGIATTRVAGPTRFETAIAVAGMRGADSAADAARVVLVEGQAENAWAAGFAAAAHSAAFDAPIVLANGDSLPAATTDFLSGGTRRAFAQDDFFADAVLTCAAAPETCEQARVAMGLTPQVAQVFDPPTGSTIEAGTTVTVTVGEAESTPIELTGECIPDATGTAPGSAEAIVSTTFTGACTVRSTITLTGGAVQYDEAIYTVEAPGSGILTYDDGIGTYAYVPGATEVLVEVGEDDTFTVDGQPATQQVFFTQATVGDTVAQTASFAQGTEVVEHALVNVEEGDYTQGLVGNVDDGGAADIIEPVSGRALRHLDLGTEALYEVDGAPTTRALFLADANEGDMVAIEGGDGGTTTTFSLTNDEITGPVHGSSIGSGIATFRIDSGGLPDNPTVSPLIGDDPTSDSDATFVVNLLATSGYELTVDGEDATGTEFGDALTDEDEVTYSREDGVETFALINMDMAASAGRVTETYSLMTNTFTLLEGSTRVNYIIAADATFTVDGVQVVRGEFDEAFTAGDGVTVTPAGSGAPQRIDLVNDTLDGILSEVTGGGDTYDVSTAGGVLYDDLDIGGDPFKVGEFDNRYYVNGTEVTDTAFSTALLDAEVGTDTIEVIAGPDTTGGQANEHRLTTSTT